MEGGQAIAQSLSALKALKTIDMSGERLHTDPPFPLHSHNQLNFPFPLAIRIFVNIPLSSILRLSSRLFHLSFLLLLPLPPIYNLTPSHTGNHLGSEGVRSVVGGLTAGTGHTLTELLLGGNTHPIPSQSHSIPSPSSYFPFASLFDKNVLPQRTFLIPSPSLSLTSSFFSFAGNDLGQAGGVVMNELIPSLPALTSLYLGSQSIFPRPFHPNFLSISSLFHPRFLLSSFILLIPFNFIYFCPTIIPTHHLITITDNGITGEVKQKIRDTVKANCHAMKDLVV